MNDYANFYRQIAEMERQATRGQRRNRASIGPGPAWERTPEANGGRGQPLPQQAPEWSSALRSARVSQGMAPEATDQPLDPVALARLRGETLEQRYSPLSEDWGWLDLGAGLGVAAGETFVDSLASPFSEGARLRNDARRTMLRDAGEGVVDALDSWTLDNPGSRDWDARSNFWEDREGATNLNELFSGSPGQQRRADVQQTLADMDARSEGFWVEPDLTITAESRPDTLTRLGAVGSDLWRGPSEAARTGRREYPVYLALEQQAREAGDVAAADEYGRMANAAALSDAVNTGSGALEAAPGTGLADTLLGLGRFTGRQVLRAAGREIPYYMNPVDWSSTAAYAGRADEAMLDPGMLTRQAEPIRNAVLAAPVGAVAADLLMDGDAGDANQLAGGALITGGAIAGLPMALRGGEEFVRGRLGRTDPLADIAPRVADDAPFAFEGAPQAGRVIDAEATPAPARNFEAAVRDPETGQVYRGQDHLEAIDSAPDEAVRARLQAIYDAPTEDPNVIGFVVDGQFMGREEGLAALRERAGRSRQVRIGEQVNRDGTVTPRIPVDWDNPNTRLPADDEWFNTLAGMPTPPRMNIVPDGGIPGRSADDMLREPRRLGAESAPDGGASGAGNWQAELRVARGSDGNWSVVDQTGERQSEHIFETEAGARAALQNMQADLPEMGNIRTLPDGDFAGREPTRLAPDAPNAGPRRLGDAVRTDAVPEDLPPLLARNPNTDEALARFRENEEGFRRALDNGPPEGNSAMPRRRLGQEPSGDGFRLSEEQRAVLSPDQGYVFERRMQGASRAEIAAEMQTSENAVGVQYNRAQRRLAEAGFDIEAPVARIGRQADGITERVAELREQGLSGADIQERLGLTPEQYKSRLSILSQRGALRPRSNQADLQDGVNQSANRTRNVSETLREPTEYARASHQRVLEAVERLAEENGGRLPYNFRDTIAERTGYQVSTIGLVMRQMRDGVYGEQMAARAGAIGYGPRGQAPVNRDFIANIMKRNPEMGPQEILDRLNAHRAGLGMEPTGITTVRSTMTQIRRGRGDAASALAGGVGLTGGGAALAFSDEAFAEDGEDQNYLDALEAYGEENDYFGPGWRVVAPRGNIPSVRSLEFVRVEDDGPHAIMRDNASGRVFYARVMRDPGGGDYGSPPGMTINVLGEMEPTGLSRSDFDPDAPRARARGEASWERPARLAGSTVAGLIVGSRVRNPIGGPAVAGLTASGLDGLFGGNDAEPVVAGSIAAIGRGAGQRFLDDVAIERMARTPEFAAQRDAFARTLSEEAPQQRATNPQAGIEMGAGGLELQVPRAEVAEQGYARNLPPSEISPREHFLSLEPREQIAWMESANSRVGRVNDNLAAWEERRAADNEVPDLPPASARPFEEPVGGFYDPVTGEPLFGGSRAAEANVPGMPPMNRRTRGERTGAAVVRRAGTRPAVDTMDGFIEAAQREGVAIERGRTKAETGRNIAAAVRNNPRLEQLARDWGLAVALSAGGLGAMASGDAESRDPLEGVY